MQIDGYGKKILHSTCRNCWHAIKWRCDLQLGHRSHMRISYDYHRIACDRFSQGIFNLARLKKMCNSLTACYSSFSSINVQDNNSGWGTEGVRGGKCGKSTSNSLSFSINKSVATKHPVDVTSPHIACSCWPMLQTPSTAHSLPSPLGQ